ncbi:MAG TPA: helix-turn-helix transcriptional regulator [Tepidisphaeraceae bacterium]|jgi:transcriptional regulator with XRE-family HTH domain|nr:helix-turn-helix transcriptional regulator [Tepidisphaeraceae bacterium]
MRIGRELRRARESAGLSQEELGKKAEITRVYVSLLERDKKSPTLAVLSRICKALNVAPSELLARAEND